MGQVYVLNFGGYCDGKKCLKAQGQCARQVVFLVKMIYGEEWCANCFQKLYFT